MQEHREKGGSRNLDFYLCTDNLYLLWSRGQIRMRQWPRRRLAQQRSSHFFLHLQQVPAQQRQVPPPVQPLPLGSRLPDPHSHQLAPRRRACNRSRCPSALPMFQSVVTQSIIAMLIRCLILIVRVSTQHHQIQAITEDLGDFYMIILIGEMKGQ